jgi:hypothetical protein
MSASQGWKLSEDRKKNGEQKKFQDLSGICVLGFGICL